MLDLICAFCGTRMLVGTRAIESLRPGGRGIHLGARCGCGAVNALRTGRRGDVST